MLLDYLFPGAKHLQVRQAIPYRPLLGIWWEIGFG